MKKLIRSAHVEQGPRLLALDDFATADEVVVEEQALDSGEMEELLSSRHIDEHQHITDAEEDIAQEQVVPLSTRESWIPSESLEQEYRQKKQEEIEAAREQAKQQGYNEGYEAGVTAGKLEYAESSERLQELLQSVANSQNDNISGLEDIAIEIVFEAVTKILGEKLVDTDGVSACVKSVIRHAEQQSNIVAHVSPSDYRLLTSDSDAPFLAADGQEIEFRPDERVDLGGCLLETGGGSLDGRLEIQLQQLKETLLLARSRPSGIEPE